MQMMPFETNHDMNKYMFWHDECTNAIVFLEFTEYILINASDLECHLIGELGGRCESMSVSAKSGPPNAGASVNTR